mgnify:CR=1 FL=1
MGRDEVIFMREDKAVYALCRKWQGILKLNDWDVVIEVGRPDELSEPDREGEVVVVLAKGEALIRLLDPNIPYDFPFPYDMEKVLVHELLHLSCAAFEPEDDSLRHDLWEQTIERMAKTLVAFQRRVENLECNE